MKRKSAVSEWSSDSGLTPTLPRVVILEDQGQPRVKVLELPEATSLGTLFFHSGTRWLVEDTRTGNRVLIARPARA